MKLKQTAIPDVVIIEPTVFSDDRGWFMESFNEARFHHELSRLGLPIPPAFVQDNHSCSKKHVLRGLHYQRPPHAQGKLVRVIKGAAYDVVVDIRQQSPTFGKSVGIELSEQNQRMLWIPEGFAHGFLALEDDTQFFYKTTAAYNKEHENMIHWKDPDLAIEWPTTCPILNERDSLAPLFKEISNITVEPPTNPIKKMIDFRIMGDDRGSLIALEAHHNIPFGIKRIYYIFGTQAGVSRGFHAHKSLEQVAVCVKGQCRMVLDDGKTQESIWLDSSCQGLHIGRMIWREMHDFSDDCVLMVLANKRYDENDYIRSYNEFKELVNQ